MELPVLWGMFEPAKDLRLRSGRPGEVHLSARDRSRSGIAPGSGSHHLPLYTAVARAFGFDLKRCPATRGPARRTVHCLAVIHTRAEALGGSVEPDNLATPRHLLQPGRVAAAAAAAAAAVCPSFSRRWAGTRADRSRLAEPPRRHP